MSRVVISENELLDAIREATVVPLDVPPKGALSVTDLCEALGIARSTVKDRLRQLRAEGRLETHHVRKIDATGRRNVIPMYTILPAPKSTRKRRA